MQTRWCVSPTVAIGELVKFGGSCRTVGTHGKSTEQFMQGRMCGTIVFRSSQMMYVAPTESGLSIDLWCLP